MKKFLAMLLAALTAMSVMTGCVAKPDGGEGQPENQVTEPTRPPRIYTPNPFTGLKKADDYKEGQRAVAIMINNIAPARPQRGLSDASWLIESKVEGGITRFMGIFEDYTKLNDVGPVRSGRDQFLRIAMPLQALYCHIGRSGITQTYIDNNDYNDFDIDGQYKAFYYKRNRPGKASEHTWYTNAEELGAAIDKFGYDMNKTYAEPLFNFVPYDNGNDGFRELNGEAVDNIKIVHSNSYRTNFEYNEAEKKYMMSMYNSKVGAFEDTIDENNGVHVGFENVLIAFADIYTYPYPGGNLDKNGNDKGDPNYQCVDMDFGGLGFYFSNGKMEKIRWFKGGPTDRLTFTDMDENPLELNCGKSYISFVDLDEYERFSYSGPEAQPTPDSDLPVNTGNETETEFE